MTLLKILFLILIIAPFALFLLYITDKLLDEMPSRSEIQAERSAVERRRRRSAARSRDESRSERTERSRSKSRGGSRSKARNRRRSRSKSRERQQ